MKIAVIGVGYVGLVTGVGFSEMGNQVTCVDIDQNKINMLNDNQIPIYEPGLTDLVISNSQKGRLNFSTDIESAINDNDILFIAVGTPSDADGKADLKYVLDVAKSIGENLTCHKYIITKSTVPVGTGSKVEKVIKEQLDKRNEKSITFDIISNPEFLKEGAAVEDFMRPDRIVIGHSSEKAKKLMEELYSPFVRNGHPILFMDIPSAEMTKYASNAMLATKISFINEIAKVCEAVGADVTEVRRGIGSDKRIGYHFIYPGLGYGGSCFPKDVKALIQTAKENNIETKILDSVENVNEEQRIRFVEKIKNFFNNDLKNKKIALWGLSFKPLTDDLREAPAITIINALSELGCELTAYDPVAIKNARAEYPNLKVKYVTDPYEALEGKDALVLITEWREFREPDFDKMKKLMKSPTVFDGRNQFIPEKLSKLGFNYISIGRKNILN